MADAFATAVNCMDGRVQHAVAELLKKKYKVDYVDMITEPGLDGVLATNQDKAAIESIKRKIGISTGRHGSKHIAVAGHHDCAGNLFSVAHQLPSDLERDHASGAVGTIVAPAARYSPSSNPLVAPAPVSTTIPAPESRRARTPDGVTATRHPPDLVSRGIPIRIARHAPAEWSPSPPRGPGRGRLSFRPCGRSPPFFPSGRR